jgi:hypothetical protein
VISVAALSCAGGKTLRLIKKRRPLLTAGLGDHGPFAEHPSGRRKGLAIAYLDQLLDPLPGKLHDQCLCVTLDRSKEASLVTQTRVAQRSNRLRALASLKAYAEHGTERPEP